MAFEISVTMLGFGRDLCNLIYYPLFCRKRKWNQLDDHDYATNIVSTENLATHALCWMIASLDGPR